ncbi:unnamed protein product [Rhizophagus irregularis]|nr:unnamed protein product [Rhizophagus irregularis]
MKSQDRSIRRNKFYVSNAIPESIRSRNFDEINFLLILTLLFKRDLILILINGEQTESSSRSSTPNSYRKIEPEIMRRLMNDGKVNNTGIDMKGLELAPTGQDNHKVRPFKIHTRNSTYYLEEIVLVYSFKTF